MPDVDCFWTVRTGMAQLSLRRWMSTTSNENNAHIPLCVDGLEYHSASRVLAEDAELALSEEGAFRMIAPALFREDPRWPTQCDRCGLVFGVTRWDGVSRFDGSVNQQINQQPIMRSVAGGEWPQHMLPAGAMFDVEFHHDCWMGADGISLCVVTPWAGQLDNRIAQWHPDGPANNAPGKIPAWTRVGDPRNPSTLTISPSIATPIYHGWLRAGKLVDA